MRSGGPNKETKFNNLKTCALKSKSSLRCSHCTYIQHLLMNIGIDGRHELNHPKINDRDELLLK
jgi:hypothetical protein